MIIKSVTVSNVTYNAVAASAVKQDELLGYLTAGLVERALRLSGEIDNSVLVPMFMGMPLAVKQKVSDILMHQVVIHGTSQVVTVADFAGKMVQYNQLLAELLRFNLSDFFDWLPSVVADARAADQSEKAM